MTKPRIWGKSSPPFGVVSKPLAVIALAATVVLVVLVLLNAPAATRTAGRRDPPAVTLRAEGRAGHPGGRAPRTLPQRAREVAAAWVEDYASTDFRDSLGRPGRLVRRFSTARLLRDMTSDSGALAFVRSSRRLERRTVAEVEATQSQEGPGYGAVVVVVYHYRTVTTTGRSRGLRTITLRLQRRSNGWKIAEVVVP